MSDYIHKNRMRAINQTREAIHAFMEKDMQKFSSFLDEDFLWMGDYDGLYAQNIQEFMQSIQEEAADGVVDIVSEEYSLLIHERHVWVVYGRFSVRSGIPLRTARVHFTFVWKQKEENLLLIYASAAHTRDQNVQEERESSRIVQSKIFDKYVPDRFLLGAPQKLCLREVDGGIRFLFPNEILYLEVRDKLCTVFTCTGSFSCRMTLRELDNPEFLLVHRSYQVNKNYVAEICRYEITLIGGTKIPVGKERYMEIKKSLICSG